MQLSVSLFFLFLAALGAGTSRAHAQVPMHDEAGRKYEARVWQFDLHSSYYQATGNYTKDGGEYDDLPKGFEYKLIDFDFGVRWIPIHNWGVYASTRVSNAESSDGVNTRRMSSLTQAVIGSDFKMYSGRNFELIPDLAVTIPLERVSTTTDQVLNREGAMEVAARLIGRAEWGMVHPFAFLGFTYRDEDRSSLAPFGVGTELQFVTWNLGGELRGYQTVVNDKYSNDRYKRNVVAAKNGGAYRYYAVDPSLLETNFWMRSQLGRHWGIKFGGGTSVTGASTSSGWNVFAGLSFAFEPSISKSRPTQQSPQPAPTYRPTTVPDPDRFQEETDDGVDQHLFRAPTPPPPPPKPAEDVERKKLQKELDRTEFQIELKKPKSKKRRK